MIITVMIRAKMWQKGVNTQIYAEQIIYNNKKNKRQDYKAV